MLSPRCLKLFLNPVGCALTRTILPQRNVRVTYKIHRTKLPRYKKNIGILPPLTKLLTDNEQVEQMDTLELRQRKLNVYKEYLPVNANTVLIEALFSTDNDVDALLRVIDNNIETMTSFYLACSFEALDDMMRANLCDPTTVAVSPEFRRLCKKTLFRIRYFESDEIIKLIKCLTTLHMPEDILIMQAALQMARHLINDFSLDEITCLSRELNRIEHATGQDKSLLRALKEAVPAIVRKNYHDLLPSKREDQ